jgi:hypothetical protein
MSVDLKDFPMAAMKVEKKENRRVEKRVLMSDLLVGMLVEYLVPRMAER